MSEKLSTALIQVGTIRDFRDLPGSGMDTEDVIKHHMTQVPAFVALRQLLTMHKTMQIVLRTVIPNRQIP